MAWSDFTTVTVLPQAGDQEASASLTGAASADLVSAASNVNGIIITGVSLSLAIAGTGTNGAPYLRLLAGGVIQLEAIINKITSDWINAVVGGLCAIEVPAGQAVSYSSSLGGATMTFFHGNVRIAWRHKS